MSSRLLLLLSWSRCLVVLLVVNGLLLSLLLLLLLSVGVWGVSDSEEASSKLLKLDIKELLSVSLQWYDKNECISNGISNGISNVASNKPAGGDKPTGQLQTTTDHLLKNADWL
jgi:hypothetical protein